MNLHFYRNPQVPLTILQYVLNILQNAKETCYKIYIKLDMNLHFYRNLNQSTYHSTECEGGLLQNLHRVEHKSTFLQKY